MKLCFKCNIFQSLENFYKHSDISDGYLNKCKECSKQHTRKYRFENDSVREYDRIRYYCDYDRKENIKNTTLNWINNNPAARKAHNKLNHAVRMGYIIKQPCKICGSTYRIHGHHNDYSKPLDIEWFCAKHHQRFHINVKQE